MIDQKSRLHLPGSRPGFRCTLNDSGELRVILCQFDIVGSQLGIWRGIGQVDELPGLFQTFTNVNLYRHGTAERRNMGLSGFGSLANVTAKHPWCS